MTVILYTQTLQAPNVMLLKEVDHEGCAVLRTHLTEHCLISCAVDKVGNACYLHLIKVTILGKKVDA